MNTLNKIFKFITNNLTLKLLMLMMINRIGDNIIWDIIPGYFSFFREITPVVYLEDGTINKSKTDKVKTKIYKEMIWALLVIVIILTFSEIFK